jgi:signal transduction histidine kinase/ActR/RegA family two-component response regulator
VTEPGLRQLLALDEPRVLQQQLRLVFDNIRSTAGPSLLIIGLVWLALAPSADATALSLWCMAQLGIKLNIDRMLRKHDRWAPLTRAQARRLHTELLIGTAAGAITWGSLVWTLRADADVAHVVVVYALLAAVQSGAVSTLAALPQLSLAYLLPSSAALLVAVGARAIVDHPAVAFGGTLFVATLLDQAIRGARAARGSIQLRFENIDLLERVRSENESATRAKAQAEQASAAKSQVLAAASHDLRQPVHAQGLFLELLKATELNEHQRDLLSRASEAVGASAAMLGTLFDYSRIEAGVVEPRRESFSVQPMLNKLEREFGPQADAKRLTYRSRESSVVLDSDPALVELILRNLIANAIRYTARGGLLVTCRPRGHGDALLAVWDTGIGIAPSDQTEVFREFHQVDNPERDRHKGFGLGLAIVDGLCRTLDHEVSVRSRPGRGSVFRVRLPRAAAGGLPAGGLGGSADQRRLLAAHVLVLDDDDTILVGMADLLRSWGCTCDTAATIEAAVALATQRAPDLLLTDYRLRSQCTGTQAITELQRVLGRPIQALMITGDTSADRLREAADNGITVLHKPVVPALLFRALIGAMAGRTAPNK